MSQIQAIFDQYNGKLSKLLVNPENIEILDVRPYEGANGENTIVDFRYDRAMGAEGVVDNTYDPESRYGERSVEIMRHDLAEVFGTQLTEITEALVEVETETQLGKSDEHRDAFLATIDFTHNLSTADVDAVISNGYISIVAKPMSLGFIGKLSVAMEGESPEGE